MSMIGNLIALRPETLKSLVDDPDAIEVFLYPDDGDSEPENHLDLDKSWHAIHFTLNGKAWEGEGPLSHVILGGTEIGEDVGYGPARYLTPEQVQEAASALKGVSPEEFGARFNHSALTAAEIYPEMWQDGDGLEYVKGHYSELRDFYLAAAGRGDSVLIYLN